MQAYPGQSFAYVEEDYFMKGESFHDGGSSVQIMRPNQHVQTPPQNHHALPGGFDKEQHHHDSWKMDKPSHGGGWSSGKEQHHHQDSWKMDKPSHGGGWSSGKEQQHHQDSRKMDKPSHGGGWLNKEKHHHHESWKVEKPGYGGGWLNNKEQHHQRDSWKMSKPSHGGNMHDGGYKYEHSSDVYLKMGDGGNGGHHYRGPPVVLNEPVKHYSDDCNPRGMQYWQSKGIDD